MYTYWQDMVVRPGYIHVVDNLVHVIWLHYSFEQSPYTGYVNNSEILTGFLMAQMAIYNYARTRTRVTFTSWSIEDGEYVLESDKERLGMKT